ncbi:MAG: cobalt ECF transporter T component CbiQ [candidate division WOR-3 bacterium]
MAQLDQALADIRALERLALQSGPVQRLDARAKTLVTAAFLVTVVSFSKYEVAGLVPLCLYPVVLLSLSRVPLGVILRHLALAAPFAVLVGLFNPLLDRTVAVHWGELAVSSGWLSFLSIIIRFLLTVSVALALLAGTGFPELSAGLGRLGLPRLLVTQFLLLHRFIFIIPEEAQRMKLAYELRSRRTRGMPIRIWGSLAGLLLLRAYDRGRRVHTAMLSRGFDGTMRSLSSRRWSWADTGFLLGSLSFLALVRFAAPAELLGRWLLGIVR